MLQKSKLVLPVLAVIVGAAASAFTATSKADKTATTRDNEFYFKFVGTPDQDEGNREDWNLLADQDAYDETICAPGNFGCKLTTSDTVMINGEAHPKTVYLSPGTNSPTTGASVSETINRSKE